MTEFDPHGFNPAQYMPRPRPVPEQTHVALQETAPARQPHLGYTLLLLVSGFVFMFLFSVAVGAAGIALHLLPRDIEQLKTGFPKTNILLEALTFLSTLGFAALVFPRMWHHAFGETIQWHRGTALRYAGRLAAGGVVLSIGAQLIESRLNLQKNMPVDAFFKHPADVWVVALFGTLVAPACEEIFFRGFLLRGLAIAWDWITTPKTEEGRLRWVENLPLSRNAWIVGGVISSGLFAAMHAAQLGFAWNAVSILWLVGGVLTYVRVRLNSVAASTVVHAVYNGTIFVIIFVATDGFRHLDKVTSH